MPLLDHPAEHARSLADNDGVLSGQAGLPQGCQTALVHYHESFWVTVGTAAPVIALAAIVSLPDVMRAREHRWRAAHPPIERLRDVPLNTNTRLRWIEFHDLNAGATQLLRWSNAIGLGNGALQLLALWMALRSLADGTNVVSPDIPEIIVPIGIFLLLVSTVQTIRVRSLAQKIRDFDFTQESEIFRMAGKPPTPANEDKQSPEPAGEGDGLPATTDVVKAGEVAAQTAAPQPAGGAPADTVMAAEVQQLEPPETVHENISAPSPEAEPSPGGG
jgi:hypothetical protein